MDDRQERSEALKRYGTARMNFEMERAELLLRFGRAFADPMRLRILALLAGRSLYGQELAEELGVAAPTISHHLTLLKAAGLVRVQRENNYHYYSLDPAGLQQIAGALTVEHLRDLAKTQAVETLYQPPPEDEERKMVQEAFFKDGCLVSIPTPSRQRRFVMEKVAQAFEWGRIYDEKEVNAILKTLHPENATLRRELIDQKLMMREHGRYWLIRPHQA
ncbi:MAG TPA: metalloregulator ArsR/SmtB family transcription factor [Ktedonobacteraceae bacterium]|nr:metalloregulator ArsR/SmtB family transcription factor [Ktedonobacteraceae bacterium]